MWSAQRITADAAEKMQVNAGLLLTNFNITNPTAPADEDILCETTGDFSISCVPTTEDFFADVNNAVTGAKEGLRITGWDCSLGVTALSITEEVLHTAIGAYKTETDGGIRPRKNYAAQDFKRLYWVGDMMDENKAFVVVMDNTVSVGGISFSSTNNGKGGLTLSIKPFTTITNPDVVPMAFYILEKVQA